MTDHTTVTLTKPITTHSGPLTSLTLREPTARCFMEYGEPFKMRNIKDANGEPSVEFDYNNKVFSHFLTDMIVENVDDLLLGDMRSSDFYVLRAQATNLILGLTGAPSP